MRNKRFLIAAITVTVLIAAYLYNKYRVAPDIEFSNLTFKTLDEQNVTLKDYESRYMLVCFAATWCKPCMEEIPSLVRAQELLAEKDVAVILVSDEPQAMVNLLWTKTGESLPVLRSDANFKELKIATLPTTYLLNEKREIIFKKTGTDNWASEKTIARLKKLAE